MLEIANKKSSLNKDQLLYRIETFPIPWLDRIKTIKPMPIKEEDISTLESDIRIEGPNSLKK